MTDVTKDGLLPTFYNAKAEQRPDVRYCMEYICRYYTLKIYSCENMTRYLNRYDTDIPTKVHVLYWPALDNIRTWDGKPCFKNTHLQTPS